MNTPRSRPTTARSRNDAPRVAIITGASHGIGAGFAARFRRARYAVVGTARTMPRSADDSYIVVDFARMVDQGSGHVVNISTSLVDHADSNRPSALPALTKGGLVAVSRSLAIEYGSRGVRVNTVSLGVIKTRGHGSTAVKPPDANSRRYLRSPVGAWTSS